MNDANRQDDYDDLDLVDSDGDTIGSIEQTYDDENGNAHLVLVKIGTLFAKQRLVPVWSAELTDDGLQVPYDKDMIEGSPDASDVGDTITQGLLNTVTEYYGGPPQTVDVEDDEAEAAVAESQTASSVGNADVSTEIRDLGDVIEIPLVEERLVKQPVVTQIVRVRKKQIANTFTAGMDVRKEALEKERIEADAVEQDGTPSGND